MRRSELTADEEELVALVRIGLADLYPERSFHVEARPLRPVPHRGWIEIAVSESGRRSRRAREPIARDQITFARLRDLRDSLLRSLRDQLGDPASASKAS